MSATHIAERHIKKYLEERGIADSSKRIYQRILGTFVDDVEPGVASWVSRAAGWIRTKDLAPKTQSLYVSTVRGFIDWCVRRGHLTENPMHDVKIQSAPTRIKKAFTKEEVRRIFDSIDHSTDGNQTPAGPERDARDLAVVTLMLHTAMRVGGAASIDVEDFEDLGEGRKLVKYLNKGHTGKDSTSVLRSNVVKVLEKYLEITNRDWTATGPLFRGPHGRISIAGLAWAIEKRFRDAGFPDASAHILRHTAATQAYLAGADLKSISDMLGHKNVTTTQGYLRSIDRTQRAAEDKIDYGE